VASDPTAETPPSERLIVTIPGLWNRGFEAWWLRRRLVEASGSPTVVFRYRTVTAEFDASVARLVRYVETLPATPVDLVGHSLGGLLALAALARLPADSVGRAVLLGPPVRGSQAVRSAIAHIPGGRLIIGRNAGLLAGGLGLSAPPDIDVGVIAGSGGVGMGRVVTRFAGPGDGTIAVDETRLPGARDALVLPVTHTGMLFSREVAEQTAYFLVHGRFRHGAAGGAQSSSSSLSA
jgi:pimeloyl-ACP methyl ester carboxylesterase